MINLWTNETQWNLSPRKLASIYAIDFLINLYLIFLITIQTSYVMGLKFSPEETNTPISV